MMWYSFFTFPILLLESMEMFGGIGCFAMKTSQVVLLIFLLLATAFLSACVTKYWCTRPCQTVYFVEKDRVNLPVTQDVFFGKVVGFYETLIYFQFGIIAVLLVLCFLYTHIISHRQAREIVDEEMRSDDFKDKTERMGRMLMTDLFNNNPELLKDNKVGEVNKKIKTMSTRISKLEKAVKNLANDIDNKPSKIQNTEVADGHEP